MRPEYRDALCLLQHILRDGGLGAGFGGMGTRRKAIAATISSLVIFGTLVASNVALYESQEQGVVLHAVSDEAKAVATEAELRRDWSRFPFSAPLSLFSRRAAIRVQTLSEPCPLSARLRFRAISGAS